MTNQHVVPIQNGRWGVKGENNSKYTRIVKPKKEAIEIAREITKNQKSELIIHNKDGKISDKDFHGNDHYPQKDSIY